jgi:hypothetical protein
VVLDERTGTSPASTKRFASLINECQTRVVIVRPVGDIMEVPWRYLEMLPRESLQSIGVAVGRPGEGLTTQFLDFAAACGAGASAPSAWWAGGPQAAYSWDGLLPLDLVGRRPPGYFHDHRVRHALRGDDADLPGPPLPPCEDPAVDDDGLATPL